MVNVLGCFVIGFFGTFTLSGSKHEVPENLRLFVMVGICGGFTTFSAFSLQTFDLLRSGAWGRALANVVVSVLLCFVSVAVRTSSCAALLSHARRLLRIASRNIPVDSPAKRPILEDGPFCYSV